VMFSPRSLSSLSESVVQSQIKHEAVVVAELRLACPYRAVPEMYH